jgi:hypothetical protein
MYGATEVNGAISSATFTIASMGLARKEDLVERPTLKAGVSVQWSHWAIIGCATALNEIARWHWRSSQHNRSLDLSAFHYNLRRDP